MFVGVLMSGGKCRAKFYMAAARSRGKHNKYVTVKGGVYFIKCVFWIVLWVVYLFAVIETRREKLNATKVVFGNA